MKIVFAGSPQFAVPTLERLATGGHEILGVITQPDRPAGREQQLQGSPVKRAALRLHLSVHQPEKIKSDEGRALMENLTGNLRAEVVVVVGYGQILPPWLLELPRYGCLNLHGSLLPAYRGAAPIQWAVANGESRTGVTTMQIDPGMDTGPILLQWETVIGPEETAVELAARMSGPGAELMLHTLAGLEAGTITPTPQDNVRATKAPLLKKEHGVIDWNMTAHQIFHRMCGFTPWPGIYSGFRGKKLQIWASRPMVMSDSGAPPGTLLVNGDEARVICGDGTMLELLQVQLESRRRMSIADFLRGSMPRPGEQLQPPPAS